MNTSEKVLVVGLNPSIDDSGYKSMYEFDLPNNTEVFGTFLIEYTGVSGENPVFSFSNLTENLELIEIYGFRNTDSSSDYVFSFDLANNNAEVQFNYDGVDVSIKMIVVARNTSGQSLLMKIQGLVVQPTSISTTCHPLELIFKGV